MIKSIQAVRYVSASLLVLVVAMTPALAQTCADVITPLLEDARANIEASDTEAALSSIDEAQAQLATCTTSPEGSSDPMAQATSEPGSTDILGMELTPESELAFVAFAHASIDAGPVDLYTAEGQEPIVSDLQFGETTEFMRVVSGSPSFVGRAAGSGPDGEVLFTSGSNLAPNTTWIVTVVGRQENLSLLAEPLSVMRTDYGGQARVRVINLMPSATADVRSSNDDDFGTGLAWLGIQDLLLDEGSYDLQINSNGEPLTEAASFDFTPETTTTLLLMGEVGSEFAPQIVPVVVSQDTTRVRFVNARADAVDIFHAPSDERIVENLAAGESTDWMTLASDAVTFTAFAPGTGPGGTQLVGLSEQLYPGRDLTVTLTDTDMSVTETALSPEE